MQSICYLRTHKHRVTLSRVARDIKEFNQQLARFWRLYIY